MNTITSNKGLEDEIKDSIEQALKEYDFDWKEKLIKDQIKKQQESRPIASSGFFNMSGSIPNRIFATGLSYSVPITYGKGLKLV